MVTLFSLPKHNTQNFDPYKNMASYEWGLLAVYGHEEILKKSSSLKPPVRF